jgi:hypothetical protein
VLLLLLAAIDLDCFAGVEEVTVDALELGLLEDAKAWL